MVISMGEIFLDSILLTIKDLIVGTDTDTAFDGEIIIHINSALSTLHELGVTKEPFRIYSEKETWSDLLEGKKNLDDVKDYVYLRVKVIFDPPSTSYVLTCMKEMIKELEWRMNVKAEGVEDSDSS